jgi:hypothetical protein
MLISLGWGIAQSITGYYDQNVMAAVIFNGMNLLTAYLSFHLLCNKTLRFEERRRYSYVWGVPFYWILLSIAAWRAFFQMFTAPHHWEKTPHFPSRIKEEEAEAANLSMPPYGLSVHRHKKSSATKPFVTNL